MHALAGVDADYHRVQVAATDVEPPEAGIDAAACERTALPSLGLGVGHPDASTANGVKALKCGIELAQYPVRAVPVEVIVGVAPIRVEVLRHGVGGIRVADPGRRARLVEVVDLVRSTGERATSSDVE